MRRTNDPWRKTQDKAHALLQEWASGHDTVDEHPGQTEETGRVQAPRGWITAPERYAARCTRWNRLDQAVCAVYAMNRDLGECLQRHYNEGKSEDRCADLSSLSLRQWRDRLYTARASFLAAYKMAAALHSEDAMRESA